MSVNRIGVGNKNELMLDKFTNSFNAYLYYNEMKNVDDILNVLKNSPERTLYLLENRLINFSDIDSERQIKVFYFVSNMLKEIEKEVKILAIKILEYIID